MTKEQGRRPNERRRKSVMQRGRRGSDFAVKHLIIALVIGLFVGVSLGYQFGRNAVAEDAAPAGADEDPTDSYGRSPGHPHYGHDHP